GIGLIPGRMRVDLELAPLLGAATLVKLPEDTTAVAVLAITRPGNHEVAVQVHGDGGRGLVAGARGVDPEFAALLVATHIESLAKDAPAAAVLASTGPGDHEVAVAVHGGGGIHLVAGCGSVDPELTPLGSTFGIVAS